MSRFLRITGHILLWAGVLFIGLGAISILVMQGPLALRQIFDPSNVVNNFAMLLTLAPGIALLALADRLEPDDPAGEAEDKEEAYLLGALKNVGAAVAGLLLIGFMIWSWHAELVDPYTWDDEYREVANSQGWTLFNDMKVGDLIFPWTLVWTPTGSMSFARPDLTLRRGDQVYAVVATVRRDEQAQVHESTDRVVVDCDERELGGFENIARDATPRDLINRQPDFSIEAPSAYLSHFCQDAD